MKSYVSQLADELRDLFRRAPLSGASLERHAQTLTWAIGHGRGDLSLRALRHMVLLRAAQDKEMAALAAALGFQHAVRGAGVRQRLGDLAQLHGNEGWRSAHRWAGAAADRLAQHIASTTKPSVLLETSLKQVEPERFTFEVHQPWLFKDYSYTGWDYLVTHDLRALSIEVDDECVLQIDDVLAGDWRVQFAVSIPQDYETRVVDFSWVGTLGFGVVVNTVDPAYYVAVTSYQQNCYVSVNRREV